MKPRVFDASAGNITGLILPSRLAHEWRSADIECTAIPTQPIRAMIWSVGCVEYKQLESQSNWKRVGMSTIRRCFGDNAISERRRLLSLATKSAFDCEIILVVGSCIIHEGLEEASRWQLPSHVHIFIFNGKIFQIHVDKIL